MSEEKKKNSPRRSVDGMRKKLRHTLGHLMQKHGPQEFPAAPDPKDTYQTWVYLDFVRARRDASRALDVFDLMEEGQLIATIPDIGEYLTDLFDSTVLLSDDAISRLGALLKPGKPFHANVDLHLKLADLLIEADRPLDIVQHFSSLVRPQGLLAENPFAHDIYANALLGLGRVWESIDHLAKLIKLDGMFRHESNLLETYNKVLTNGLMPMYGAHQFPPVPDPKDTFRTLVYLDFAKVRGDASRALDAFDLMEEGELITSLPEVGQYLNALFNSTALPLDQGIPRLKGLLKPGKPFHANVYLHCTLTNLLIKSDRPLDAVQYLEPYLAPGQLLAKDPVAHKIYAQALRFSGQSNIAAQHLANLIVPQGLLHHSAFAHDIYANCLVDMDRTEEAMDHLAPLVVRGGIFSHERVLHATYTKTLLKSGFAESAVQHLEALFKEKGARFAQDPFLQHSYAHALLKSDRPEQARGYLSRLVFPGAALAKDSAAQVLFAQALERCGDRHEAIRYLEDLTRPGEWMAADDVAKNILSGMNKSPCPVYNMKI